MRFFIWFLMATLASFANAAVPIHGVNIHEGGGTTTANEQIATIMKNRNFKTARFDHIHNGAMLRDQLAKIKANGGYSEAVTLPSFHWDNSCNQNLTTVETTAYNDTAALVNGMKDLVQTFELLNETRIRPEINAEVPWNVHGQDSTVYANKPCVRSLVAALKGMSRAIVDIRNSTGEPLKIIFGHLGRDFGFLDYIIQQGVVFDFLGYHHYPQFPQSLLSDTWYGPGGLGAQLAKYNKPVHWNEFNCGETYLYPNYNVEDCIKSLDKHLLELRNQTQINLKSIHFYELLDEPQKSGAEAIFGLMVNPTQPKVQLYVATAYAGGQLSTAERNEIINRGLMTNAEIDSMQQGGGGQQESANNTTIPPATQIVDDRGAIWTICGSAQVCRNGVTTISSNVDLILYYDPATDTPPGRIVYQRNTVGDYYWWDNSVTSGNPWQGPVTDPRVPQGPPESPHNTTIPPAANIVDSAGVTWTVSGGQIYRNGVVDPVTSNVNLLLYWNQTIYQRNTFNNWYVWIGNGWGPSSDPRAPADTTNPTVSVTFPANGATFTRGQSITMTANAADNVGVNRVEFRSDGALKCTDTTAPYSCQFNLPGGKRRTNIQLSATAFDAAGNNASHQVLVNTQ